MSWLSALSLSNNVMPPVNIEEVVLNKSWDDFVPVSDAEYTENQFLNSGCSYSTLNNFVHDQLSFSAVEEEVEHRILEGESRLENDSAEISSLKKSIKKLESAVNDLVVSNTKYKVQVIDLQRETEELWQKMYATERDLTQFMQYNRRENVEIAGIPQTIPDNEIEGYVITMLGNIGVRVSHYDIAGCHRLYNRKSQSTNVIVRFVCRQHARECLYNKRKLTYIPEYKNLYIIENLCPRYKEIYEQCLKMKKTKDIKHVWTYNGTICIKKSDNRNEKPIKILHVNDLNYYIPEAK